MTFIEKKVEEYVSRKFPNADLGYCGHQSERYKAAFLAGYEQCKEDMSGWHFLRDGFPPPGTYLWFLPQNKFRVATAYTMATGNQNPIAWKKLDYPNAAEVKNAGTR